jgi:hypothetical protein
MPAAFSLLALSGLAVPIEFDAQQGAIVRNGAAAKTVKSS